MKIRSIHMFIVMGLLISAIPITAANVAGEKYTPANSGGYSYIDGEDPEPKVECDYIDLKFQNEAVGHDVDSYNTLLTIDLPFSFTYYETSYNKVYVSNRIAFSFVETNVNSFTYYSNHPMPSTNDPKGILAVYWGQDYAYDYYNPKTIFTLHTEVDGEEVFIIEWITRNGGKYEALLFKGGMIKYQYQSVYTWGGVGSYAVIGIENPAGTRGISIHEYKYEPTGTDIFQPPYAYAFTTGDIEVTEPELTNGDGSRGDMVYAESKDYVFSSMISHTKGEDHINRVFLTLSPHFERLRFIYFHSNSTFYQPGGTGDMKFATLNEILSQVSVIGPDTIKVDFYIDFKIDYPSETARNVSVTATGLSAIPGFSEAADIYRVENDFEWSDTDLVCKTSSGTLLTDNDWVKGRENIQFTGIMIVYEDSNVQPRPYVAQISIKDNYNTDRDYFIPQGNWLSAPWTAVDFTAQMQFTFYITGLTFLNLVSGKSSNKTFSLRIDTDKPAAVGFIKTYADSLDENASIMDNDRNMFVEWEASDDGGSGLGSYIIEAVSGEFRSKNTVPADRLNYHIGRRLSDELPEGEINITIRAVDAVGNIGPPTWTRFLVDLHGPSYEMIDPAQGEWAESKTPFITFRASDELSGIEGRSLLFRASRDDGMTWSDWNSCQEYNTGGELEFQIRPSLVEGRRNLVVIKGQDMARSGETLSDEFRVWVDSRAPDISLDDLEVDEEGTVIDWLETSDVPIDVKIHDWLGSGLDTTRITYRYSVDNGTSFSADIPLEAEPYNNSLGYQEVSIQITKSSWIPGDQNLLRIDAYDNVGRNSSMTYRIRVDSPPDIEILKPVLGVSYLDNQSIPFEVRIDDPDGNEDVEVQWISNIDGSLGTAAISFFYLSAGDHLITLTVRDGVHKVRRTFSVIVLDSILQNPKFKDTDGDGMNDSFEIRYGLNPEVDDASEDPDYDGYSNLDEYLGGSDPTDKNSYPGSSVKEDVFPLIPLIILLVGAVLFITLSLLVILEMRKAPTAPAMPPPPAGLYPNQTSAIGPGYQTPALPPAGGNRYN
ncbi:MAG: hypothetical protein ACMUIG_00415 [Thermoplasmatota archaeon]